jgi:putative N6-adenine-specific DNA methylase
VAEYNLVSPCSFGLEKTLCYEIRRAGGKDETPTDGRVEYKGDERVIASMNLSSSVAERVGVVIGKFKAETFDDVYNNLLKADCSFIPRDGKFPIVKGQSVKSKLTSVPALQRTVKKALANNLTAFHGTDLPETGAEFPVRFFLFKDVITVLADASGIMLHKRGYRAESGQAPLKETLAAGIADLAHLRSGDIVVDPFCGSGTILIEAALKLRRMPPGFNRRFSSEFWGDRFESAYSEAKAELSQDVIKTNEVFCYGYDIDADSLRVARQNAEKAGVASNIVFSKRSIADFVPPTEKFKVVTNPPYGERMGEEAEAAELTRLTGEVLSGYEAHIISSVSNFELYYGKKAVRNRKLYNGMIMCRLYSMM